MRAILKQPPGRYSLGFLQAKTVILILSKKISVKKLHLNP